MKLIDFSDIKKIDFSNIEEKQKDIIIANIIYYLLKGKISEEELKLFPNDINNKIQIVLNKETKNDQYYKIVKYLDKILVKEAVDLGEGYSIENFIKKDDFDPVFEYKCEYSKPLGKVALGLIFPEDSFFL